MTLRRLVRATALAVLGMMMLVRMGPLCESMAMAAPPVSGRTAMSDCERPSTGQRPDGKAMFGACAGACVATEDDRQVAAAEPVLLPGGHGVSLQRPLEGLSDAPAPPPPRTA